MSNYRPSQMEIIVDYLSTLNSRAGFENYCPTIAHIIAISSPKTLLEVGAGRFPLLSEVTAHAGVHHTINDIDAQELAAAECDADHELFDIAGNEISTSKYDLVVSRSVLEHVSDARRAITNSALLLNPGGYALHFYPSLYASPFIANKLLPERIASQLLRVVAPRDLSQSPKFPARYRGCTALASTELKLNDRANPCLVRLVPYYDHRYYDRLPIVAPLARYWHKVLTKYDVRTFSSFVFAVVHRPI